MKRRKKQNGPNQKGEPERRTLSALRFYESLCRMEKRGVSALKRLLLLLIRFYQTQISPGLPPRCRFVPTCSEYAKEAVEKYGASRGSLLAAKRLAKCQPFHRQKYIEYDPVP